MKKKFKYNLSSSLITVLLSGSVFFYSCGSEELDNMGEVIELTDSIPTRVFKDVSILYSQGSIVRLKLEAPVQNQFENQDEIYPDGLYMEIYDSLGTKTTSLVADYGTHSFKKNTFRVTGNVVVINFTEDTKLETDILNWDQSSEMIYTDTLTPVVITSPKEVIKANGLRANQDFTNYEITGGVTGIFTFKDE